MDFSLVLRLREVSMHIMCVEILQSFINEIRENPVLPEEIALDRAIREWDK